MRGFYPVIMTLIIGLGTVLSDPAFSQPMTPEDARRTLQILNVPYTDDALCESVKEDELTIVESSFAGTCHVYHRTLQSSVDMIGHGLFGYGDVLHAGGRAGSLRKVLRLAFP